MMRRNRMSSIRIQYSLIFIGLMIGIIVLCIVFNVLLLPDFYQRSKVKSLKNVYNSIVEAYENGNIIDSEVETTINDISRANNMSVVVVGSDSNPIFTSMMFERDMEYRLMGYIFGNSADTEVVDIVESTEEYTIRKLNGMGHDGGEHDGGRLELLSRVDGEISVLLSVPVESIKESTDFASRFMMYVGLLFALLGATVVFFVTKSLTKPIESLNELSKKMVNLDFNARYTGNDNNEIGVLGDNMNKLSESLEKSIGELKTANLELKKDIEKKEALDEMRMEFISNISHELKTPIAIIQGYAEGLKEGISDDPESREYYCDVIMDESKKMNEMVKKFLALNSLEFGGQSISFERFDIIAMISNYLNSAQILTDDNSIELEFDNSKEIGVWGDEYMAEEVFTNYFSNAVHYCLPDKDGKKRISITCEKIEDNLRVSVFNTGEPIPEESIDRLWEKFYKVDKARTRAYGGSGVGLSIVKAVQESLGKAYGVENHEDGVAFWFELECR